MDEPVESKQAARRRTLIDARTSEYASRILGRVEDHVGVTIANEQEYSIRQCIKEVLEPLAERLQYLEDSAVFCFSEDGVPVYIQGVEKGEHEITDHITADAANGMVKRISELMDKIRNVPTPTPAPSLSGNFKHYNDIMIRLTMSDSDGIIRTLHGLGTGELYELRKFLQMYGDKEVLIAAIDAEFKNTD